MKKQHDPTTVQYAQGDGNYTRLYLASGQMELVSNTLKIFEKRWPDFIRASKSHLVNPFYVSSITTRNYRHGTLRMRDGTVLEISRRRFKEVNNRMDVYYKF